MACVADKQTAPLGAVQQTLFIPLLARARAAQRRQPLLRDPKAVEIAGSVDIDAKYGRGAGGSVTVLRTVLMDAWVRDFLTAHPAGTVIEIGTGLNSRFERVDNGQVHWIDLDLPDAIELRRKSAATCPPAIAFCCPWRSRSWARPCGSPCSRPDPGRSGLRCPGAGAQTSRTILPSRCPCSSRR
jgi:hypothetical protein